MKTKLHICYTGAERSSLCLFWLVGQTQRALWIQVSCVQDTDKQGMGRIEQMEKPTDLSATEKLFQDLLGRTGETVAITPQRMARTRRERAVQAEIEPVLSIVEAAKACGISRHQIDNAINCGALAFYDFGDRRKIKLSDLKKWLESKRTKIGTYN